MNYKRITKREAKRLWREGKEVCLMPCNFAINNLWVTPCPVEAQGYVEKVESFFRIYERFPQNKRPNSIDWSYADENELYEKAWNIMYNNWAFYNTNYKMGYYAHYYVRERG